MATFFKPAPFKAPKHWVIEPNEATAQDMAENKEYREYLVEVYEKANIFYNKLYGRTKKVQERYLMRACVILAQEFYSKHSGNPKWIKAIKREGDKIRRRLGVSESAYI